MGEVLSQEACDRSRRHRSSASRVVFTRADRRIDQFDDCRLWAEAAGKSYLHWAKALLRATPRFSRDSVAQQSIIEDNRFFHAPPEAPELLHRACRLLGLEKAAIDYSVKACGEIVLWEANPYFAVIPRQSFILPEERLFSEHRRRLIEDGHRFLASLTGTAR